MGDPRKLKKQWESPRKKWDKDRLEKERKLKEFYGLKNKKEIRRTETILRKKRENARSLLALPQQERQKRGVELLNSLDRMGVLKKNATPDDVLGLSIEELMERRLQTIVWRKNLAKTIKQARQFITHGHIAIAGKKVTCAGYMVRREEEDKIGYFGKPPLLKPKKIEKPKKQAAEECLEEKTEGAKAEEKVAAEEIEEKDKEAEVKEKGEKEGVEKKVTDKSEGVKEGKEEPAEEKKESKEEKAEGDKE